MPKFKEEVHQLYVLQKDWKRKKEKIIQFSCTHQKIFLKLVQIDNSTYRYYPFSWVKINRY